MSQEERFDWAASVDKHSERMFRETANPYYVVAAIGSARFVGWKSPKWALEALLQGVEKAYWLSSRYGTDPSIDRALGLKIKRGGGSLARRAQKASIEASIFDLVRVIYTCFDVSIPVACETAFYAIDYDFARSMEEVLHREWKISDERLAEAGLTREWHAATEASEIARSNAIIEETGHTEAVKEKLRSYQWWSITRGDRIGYSLEQLIDRYYRIGSKREIPHGKAPERLAIHFDGSFLLLRPEWCTHEITNLDEIRNRKVEPPTGKSALAHFARRNDFDDFEKALNRSLGSL